jgi:hypothetical protein
MPDEPTEASVCRLCRTRRCPDLLTVSRAQGVLIHIGMMSCQVEQACLCCRELARLHKVVQGRVTAGTFVAKACSQSLGEGPNSILVSAVKEAQVRTTTLISCLV